MTVTLESIDKESLRRLLLRNWMTHDAMWFMNAAQTLGIEQANALNRAAVRGMAGVEAKRLCKVLGVGRVTTPQELREFFDAAIELVIPDFMDFAWEWAPDRRSVRFEVTKCFAYEGVTALGVADAYECGIYERIYGWLDALGISYEVVPDDTHCSMHHEGRCQRELTFGFPMSRSPDRRPEVDVVSPPRDKSEATRVRDVLDRLICDGSVVARSDGTTHSVFPVAINEGEGASLREWVQREHAQHTIEIGLGYGISALFICEGLLTNDGRTTRHVVVDPHQERRFANCGLQVLDDAGLAPLLEYHPSPSQSLLPRLLDEERTFDLAMVDGNHRFDAVLVDLVYLGRLLRPGSVVFLDDYQLPGVAKAAAFFLTNLNWTLEEVSPDDPVHQWAVLRTSRTGDTRPFDYFADF